VARPVRATAGDERGRPGGRAGAGGDAEAQGLHGVRGEIVERVPAELDRLIHERLRLGIVSALAVNDVLSFSDLKKLMHTTDGNLSVHARKLEEAGYVECRKGFDGRVPRTEYRLTAVGRQALERYLDHMEALITATRERA
jgi:DNA-binding HxlR family transcriptional regulator